MSTFYDALKKAQNLNPVKHAAKAKKDIPPVFVVISIIVVFLVVFNISKVNHAKKIAAGKNKTAGKLYSLKTPDAKSAKAIVKKIYSGYELEGIICNETNCIAVINGKILKPESAIDDFIVTNISSGSVELRSSKDSRITNLNLK